ncbi:unnamed protein product [Lymnaea stagnalis]|uniref:Uncharacterized protein n=1 Tax=Lymnaea stagnalis TaxID=6523 RepID=A0AAV2I737_LYMST
MRTYFSFQHLLIGYHTYRYTDSNPTELLPTVYRDTLCGKRKWSCSVNQAHCNSATEKNDEPPWKTEKGATMQISVHQDRLPSWRIAPDQAADRAFCIKTSCYHGFFAPDQDANRPVCNKSLCQQMPFPTVPDVTRIQSTWRRLCDVWYRHHLHCFVLHGLFAVSLWPMTSTTSDEALKLNA